jgi:hypothetical protein
MADKVVELTPTQQAIAENDAREGAKAEFDSKIHGVGTVAPVAPNSVSELFKLHQALEAKFDGLEGDAATYLSGMLNSIESRIRELEKRVMGLPADSAPAQPPAAVNTGTGSNTETGQIGADPSVFSKKKSSVQ